MIFTAATSADSVLLDYGALGAIVVILLGVVAFLGRRIIRESDALRSENREWVKLSADLVPLLKRSNEIHMMRQQADDKDREQIGELIQIVARMSDDNEARGREHARGREQVDRLSSLVEEVGRDVRRLREGQ